MKKQHGTRAPLTHLTTNDHLLLDLGENGADPEKKKEKVVRLLDGKRAYAIDITLSTFRTSFEDLRKGIMVCGCV